MKILGILQNQWFKDPERVQAFFARHPESERPLRRNPSELVRFLIHREYKRRKTRSSVVADAEVSTDWRNGRPKVKGMTRLDNQLSGANHGS